MCLCPALRHCLAPSLPPPLHPLRSLCRLSPRPLPPAWPPPGSRPGNFDLEMFWKKIAGEGREGGKGTEARGVCQKNGGSASFREVPCGRAGDGNRSGKMRMRMKTSLGKPTTQHNTKRSLEFSFSVFAGAPKLDAGSSRRERERDARPPPPPPAFHEPCDGGWSLPLSPHDHHLRRRLTSLPPISSPPFAVGATSFGYDEVQESSCETDRKGLSSNTRQIEREKERDGRGC